MKKIKKDSLNQTEIWKNLYKKYFNLDIDVSIIKEIEGKWAIFIAKGMKIQQVYDALPFAKWKYVNGDLNKAIPKNDRVSNKDYVVYVNKNIEADEKFKNKSANDLKQMNHKGITLLEGLLLPFFVWTKDKKHLDVNNITLCSGSRDSDGDVLSVGWYGVMLKVFWYKSSRSSSNLRSREVICN